MQCYNKCVKITVLTIKLEIATSKGLLFYASNFNSVKLRGMVFNMSRYIDTASRRRSMIQSLGEAAELVSNHKFLPMFRNRQINYQAEFEFTVKLAKTKKNPQRFFAKIWSKANLKQTLDWMRQAINRIASEAAHKRYKEQTKRQLEYEAQIVNQTGLKAYQLLKRQMLPNLS